MNNMNFEKKEIKEIFSSIGLASENGIEYRERLRKHKQVYDYIVHINKALDKLSSKREIILLDCGCGKSYLSFIANYYFSEIEKRNVKFICIDYNEHVILKSRQAAEELGFKNMDFICGDIFKTDLKVNPDIVYSLHACDTATDMTIAKGIASDAKFIMTVSCCQHSVRYQLRNKTINSITRHGIYKERLADMVSDSMRALILELSGYKVSIFEYVPSSETPKNVMVRAIKCGKPGDLSRDRMENQYEKLKKVFSTDVKINDYVKMMESGC